MEKKFNFVYITTNLKNGKQYIGDHSTNDLNDSYLGGGLLLKKSIKKNGKQIFKREILEFFDTKQKAFAAQENYIIQYNTINPNGYNISPKGGHFSKGSLSEETKRKIGEKNKISLKGKKIPRDIVEKMRKSNTGKKRTEEQRKKMSIIQKKVQLEVQNREEVKEKRRKKMLGKKHTEETKKLISKNNARCTYWKDKKLSEEHKNNISLGNKGKKPWNTNKKLSEEHKRNIGNGGKGKVLSDETKLKMSLASKGKPKSPEHKLKCGLANLGKVYPKTYCEYCEKEYANHMYKIYHGDKCKNKII